MLSFTKWIYLEYHPLIAKMHVENVKSDGVGKKLSCLCDVEVILRLSCIIPLFECVHALIKIAYRKNIFVCNFVDFVKIVQQKFYQFYCDPYVKFEDLTFNDFNVVEILTNNNLSMDWFSNLNGGEDAVYFAFLFFGHKYLIYYIGEDGFASPQPITKEAFGRVVNKVKEECEGAT